MCGRLIHDRAPIRVSGAQVGCGTCGLTYLAKGETTDRFGRIASHCPNCQMTNTYRRPAMPCDTRLKARQTIQERKTEVLAAVERLNKGLVNGTIKPKVGPQGAITFVDWLDSSRDGVTDACAFRRLMVTGSALAKAAITRAEQIAGRSVDRQALAQGHHSHDGGRTWHHGH